MIKNASRASAPALAATLMSGLLLAACGGDGDGEPTPPTTATLTCDDTLKANFKPDANTTVVAVKAFKKDDPLILSGTPTDQTPLAQNDLCMVKLNVGPGNPGPADALSTSPGIGIEIWLPAKANWNNRVRALGGGGWQGGPHGSPTVIANQLTPFAGVNAASIAGTEGAVTSATDTGHANTTNGGSFAMKPDGSINTPLWTDFASRSLHEQAVKTKALATAYYGTAPKWMYWDGGSTGGRQGLNLAQNHPDDFDGIIANYPALNWTRMSINELYPHVVFQRDLGGVALTIAQQTLVSNAAINACGTVGGQPLGFILDPASCTYNPVNDANVLCASDGGTNNTAACVTKVQANAMNKIWYGMTADGSVPDPSADNGWPQAVSPSLPSGNQRWFGLARGTNTALIGMAPFIVGTDQVALNLQDPTFAGPTFLNATGNGQSKWAGLSYADFSNAFDQGVALNTAFGGINTDNPDLSAFKKRGGKMLAYHGLNDELIPPQGTVNYYHRVIGQMGGLANVQDFYRLYLVPGTGHGSSVNGTANPAANPPIWAANQQYQALTDWVEKGIAPQAIVLNSRSATPIAKSLPACVYPSKVTYLGSGDPFAAASYACR